MKVLTKALIKESEEAAVKSGAFSFKELMFIAGNRAAEIINQRFNCQNKKIAVVCGKGNNGGDGCVIARWLYELGADVTVITPMGAPTTENAAYYYSKLEPIKKSSSLSGKYDIIVDALFGIGIDRELDSKICSLINEINLADAHRISVDIPSGVESDSGRVLGAAVKADLTVTFIALKPCFLLPDGSEFCGKTVVADIDVPISSCEYLTTEKPVFSKRPKNSHKGNFGTALLICGSYGMAGAAILSARAALRSGVGIAKCVLCEGIYPAFTAAVPEAVCLPVKQTDNGTLTQDLDIPALTKKSTALLFGCGVGQSETTFNILKNILENAEIPTVIDADGINLLSNSINLLKKSKAPIILTPHSGEMARLCGKTVAEIEQNRVAYARNFAKEYGCTVVLKGANTIIAEQTGEITFNLTGNAGMATGGSGDVLAGITVSLLAQGIPVTNAVKAAVYLHGEAGDKATARKGERAALPSDVIDEL